MGTSASCITLASQLEHRTMADLGGARDLQIMQDHRGIVTASDAAASGEVDFLQVGLVVLLLPLTDWFQLYP